MEYGPAYLFGLIVLLLVAAWFGTVRAIRTKQLKLVPVEGPVSNLRPLSSLFVSFGAYMWPQLLIVFVIGAIMLRTGSVTPPDLTVVQSFAVNGFVSLIMIFTVWRYLKWRKVTFRDIGFKKPKWFVLVDIVAGYGVYFVLTLVLRAVFFSVFTGIDADQQQVTGFENAATSLLPIVFVGLVILPPIAEETLFRGLLYRGLRNGAPKWLAAITTSVLFGLAHQQWNVALDTFALSMVLIYLVESTGTIWAAIGLHALKNFIAFTVLFVLQR